ncbi:MAG: hypothetical protein DMF67_00020 [Acidobacteria bacterium]|nr:MAG: hypothetical protein DMF67_00020 [Acidobacteriota bacterium]
MITRSIAGGAREVQKTGGRRQRQEAVRKLKGSRVLHDRLPYHFYLLPAVCPCRLPTVYCLPPSAFCLLPSWRIRSVPSPTVKESVAPPAPARACSERSVGLVSSRGASPA